MDYGKEEFKRLRWNVHANIPSFLDIDVKGVDKHTFARWVSYCFDKNSPYVRDFDDFKRRAVTVLVDLGATDKNNRVKSQYMKLATGTHEDNTAINVAIIEYLRSQNDHLFTQIAMFQKALAKSYEDLLEQNDDSKKDIISSINSMSDVITKNIQRMTSGNNNQELIEDIMDEVNSYNMELTIEELAHNRKMREEYRKQMNYLGGWTFDRFNESDMTDAEYEQMKAEMSNDTEDARKFFDAIGIGAEKELVIKRQREATEHYLSKEKDGRKNRR